MARGVDVTLFAILDSVTSARLDGVCPGDMPMTRCGRSGVGGHARRPYAGPLGRVRPPAQSSGLAVVSVRRTLPRPAANHGPRFLRRGNPARVRPRGRPTCRSPMPTVPPGWTTSPPCITASTSTGCRSPPTGDRAWWRSAGCIRTRATTAIEIARLAGGRLTICGIVRDDQYFTEQVAPHIDGELVVSRFGRPEATRGDHWLGGGPAPSDRLRRAVRLVRCRVDGLRHTGRGVPARVHAGSCRRGRHGVPRVRRAAGRGHGRRDRHGRLGRCRARAEQRSSGDRMVADYLRIYRDLSAG